MKNTIFHNIAAFSINEKLHNILLLFNTIFGSIFPESKGWCHGQADGRTEKHFFCYNIYLLIFCEDSAGQSI